MTEIAMAEIELCGGPMDGQRYVTIVGAPLVIRAERPVSEKKDHAAPTYLFLGFGHSIIAQIEGDDWEALTEQNGAAKEKTRYVLYLPRRTNTGETMGYADYAGEEAL